MTLTDKQLKRYIRQISLDGFGEQAQKKLISASVLVIGAGALGSACLLYLAGAGIGNIGIADADVVSVSNLHRQIIHKTDNVGGSKLESAKSTISELNPNVNVTLHEGLVDSSNIEKILSDYDFIIDCTDNFKTKFLINDTCVKLNKPYSHAGVLAYGGQLMTYVPQKGPCLRCILGDVPEKDDAKSANEVGIIGPACGIAGSIQAAEAIKYITGMDGLLTGRLLKFDVLKTEFKTIKISAPNLDCPVCRNF